MLQSVDRRRLDQAVSCIFWRILSNYGCGRFLLVTAYFENPRETNSRCADVGFIYAALRAEQADARLRGGAMKRGRTACG